MGTKFGIFCGIIAVVATVALSIIAYSLLLTAPANGDVAVDFNTILTVLLATVTVFFTVSGLVLALLGLVGFQNLKRDAGQFAEKQALAEIANAFGPTGRGTKCVEDEMKRAGGHHQQFVEKIVRTEVISLLPLVADRLNVEALSASLAEPTDEGDVD